jgi:hypothetical protein
LASRSPREFTRATVKKTGRSFVFAAVILISNTKRYGFGYKDMTESMGPCEADCPDRIMRLLSNPGYAADWRTRVAARKTARREQRDRLAALSRNWAPASFRGGITASSFRLAYFRRRTPVFEALDRPGFYCRLNAATLAAATIAVP